MNTHHYLGIVIFALVAYMIGVKFPAFGQTLAAKVGM